MRSPHRCGAQASSTFGAVREQPAADDRFGEPRALLARGRGGEIAKPGEALQLLGRPRRRRPIAAKSSSLSEIVSLPTVKSPGEEGLAALAVAVDMIARDGDELQRLLRPRLRRDSSEPARELRDDRAFGGRAVVAHPCPSKRLDIVGVGGGPAAERGGAGDERGRARIDRLPRGLGIDPAVDLELDVELPLGDAVGDRLDLLELARR